MTAREQFLNPVARPLVCYVTDRRAFPPPSLCSASTQLGWASHLLEAIAHAAEAGVNMVQLREKDLSGKALLDLATAAQSRVARGAACGALLVNDRLDAALASDARKGTALAVPNATQNQGALAPEARRAGVGSGHENVPALIVNDRLDVALAAGAAGVHLGGESVPVSAVTRLRKDCLPGAQSLPKGFLIGRSCHSLDEALEAEHSGADYIFIGPVFATPSKVQFGPPQGLDALSAVCRAVCIPVLAIGGITLENAPSCISSGAAGIAAIRLFQESSDLSAVVRALKRQ